MQRILDKERMTSTAASRPDESAPHQVRNFLALALHQIITRVGWIFKTESIIMPAFLDAVGGTGWLRGCLPMLNRFGHSVPPLLFSRRLKVMRRKKWALAGCSLGMALPFAILSGVWYFRSVLASEWMPYVFLLLYGIFFALTGMAQLAMHTLQGKLVAATRRGRLLTLSSAAGVSAAIVGAWWLLGDWLALPGGGFQYIFGFCAVAFAVAATCAILLAEPADDYEESFSGTLDHFAAAWQVFRTDASFRTLAIVASLFGTVLILFPHYQALARERLGMSFSNLTLWVIVQNAGTGCFSLLAGPVADWRGNRIVLRACIFCSATVPLLALLLVWSDPAIGRSLFWIVFVPIGLTPVTFRILNNYTLELSDPVDHPRYVSTLGLCVATPIMLLSPLVGLLVSYLGFEVVFLTGACAILLGGVLTFRLYEPRHGARKPIADPGMDLEEA